MEISNPRDYIGYGRDKVPDANWPGGAKIALQFVLNYEEGGENCVLHGDPHAETFLSEIAGAEPFPARHNEHGVPVRIRFARWGMAHS